MGAKEFGQLVDAARSERGWSLARVAVAIGVLDDGRALNETQAKRILEGRRVLDPTIVRRLTEALDLDPLEVLEATGPYSIKELRQLLDTRDALTVAAGQAEMDQRIAAGATHAAEQAARRPRRARQRNHGRPGGPERTNASNGGLRRPVSPVRPRLHLVDQPTDQPAEQPAPARAA